MKIKRISDLFFSFLSLPFLLPLLLLYVLFSKTVCPKRPVFYTAERYGKDREIFRVFKLRTLDESGEVISPLHAFMRAKGLDELPQIINVLRGEMSLVGPRPLDVTETEPDRLRKEAGIYALTPGITGWAQINGGSSITDEEKTLRDSEYLHGRSFYIDWLILKETLRCVLGRREYSAPGTVNVFVLSSFGLPARYGGFETLTENLNRNRSVDIRYHVSGIGKNSSYEYKGAQCRNFPGKSRAGRMLSAARSFLWAIREIKRNPLEKNVVLVLGCRAGIFAPALHRRLKKFNAPLLVHPDGIEESRKKHRGLSARFVALSQQMLLEAADEIVFDSRAVRAHYNSDKPSRIIAYGAEAPGADETAYKVFLKQYGLKKGEYFLMVSRMVPENNFEMAAEAASGLSCPLVILSQREGKYYERLKKDFPGAVFAGPVYDKGLLGSIRTGSRAIIHAHSAGGTNPGLIEAIFSGVPVYVQDTPSNRETGGDAVFYFKTPKELCRLLENVPSVSEEKLKIAERKYSWEKIAENYEKLFRESVSERNNPRVQCGEDDRRVSGKHWGQIGYGNNRDK